MSTPPQGTALFEVYSLVRRNDIVMKMFQRKPSPQHIDALFYSMITISEKQQMADQLQSEHVCQNEKLS